MKNILALDLDNVGSTLDLPTTYGLCDQVNWLSPNFTC